MKSSPAPEYLPPCPGRALRGYTGRPWGCGVPAMLVALGLLGCGPVLGAEPRTPPPSPEDPDLLEFLGGSDPSTDNSADDGAWIDYLSGTDIGRVARSAPPDTKPDGVPAAPANPDPDVRHD